jgi:hypothetical protein
VRSRILKLRASKSSQGVAAEFAFQEEMVHREEVTCKSPEPSPTFASKIKDRKYGHECSVKEQLLQEDKLLERKRSFCNRAHSLLFGLCLIIICGIHPKHADSYQILF